jgi:hypothetical protein
MKAGEQKVDPQKGKQDGQKPGYGQEGCPAPPPTHGQTLMEQGGI